jgi:hypothetical protein
MFVPEGIRIVPELGERQPSQRVPVMVDLAASGKLDLIDEPARKPGRALGSRVAVDEVAKRRGDSAQATRRVVRVALDPVRDAIGVLPDLNTVESELGGRVVPSDPRACPWPRFLGETTVAVGKADRAKVQSLSWLGFYVQSLDGHKRYVAFRNLRGE